MEGENMEMSNPEGIPKTRAENLKGTSATDATELEDPFDDPALVTNAFLDIMWQDADGNSALMLAAAENRMLHVKGILTMAAQRGTLWQVLDMRNDNGLSALEMALRSGSDTCAMLITRFAKEYQKTRPRFRRMSFTRRGSNEASETDIMIEFDDAPPAAVPFASRRPFILNPPPRRLSRDKISNHLKRIPPNDCAREMNRAGRPPPPNKWVQRTISNDSQSSLPSPSSSAASPVENKSISVGDKLRSIFSSRRHAASESSTTRRPQEYTKNDEENQLLDTSSTQSSNISSERKISAEEPFRSPWPTSRPTRLPPLANLRRRTASETRPKPAQEL